MGAMEVEICQGGNIGNRIIQYLGANHLARELGCGVSGANLPELGICGPAPAKAGPRLVVEAHKGARFDEVLEAAREFQCVQVRDHLQRMAWLGDRATAAALIPEISGGIHIPDDVLLINVRAGEIVDGVSHYPLVPVDWYARIINLSGLPPVFMGQTEGSAYTNALRAAYPKALFLPSQGVLADFQMVRSARHIVISVSTFSWIAAWLSNAEQIYFPMLGFLNPAHVPDGSIDLLPDDPRYRYFLFPLHYGMDERQAVAAQHEVARRVREVSRAEALYLKQLPLQAPPVTADFDAFWFVNAHPDLGMAISEGRFSSPEAALLATGMPGMPEGFSYQESAGLRDIAAGKPASQSSIPQEFEMQDPRDLIRGAPSFPWAIHTNWEMGPWWQVDLDAVCTITEVRILNRVEDIGYCARALPLTAKISFEGEIWLELFTTPGGLWFGRDGRKLVWKAKELVKTRFLRLEVARMTCLHLAQVQVLGP